MSFDLPVIAGGSAFVALVTALLTLVRWILVRADREVERWRGYAERSDSRADKVLESSRELLATMRSVETLVRDRAAQAMPTRDVA